MVHWSYGGGVQSVAIGVLIAQGLLPVPDFAAIADTTYELPSTWDYLRLHMQPMLDQLGLTIHVVERSYSNVDLYGMNGDLLIPAFSSTGKLRTFCSGEWKGLAIRRWLRERVGPGRRLRIANWIGYSADESERVKPSNVKWLANAYPLLHLLPRPLDRDDCIEVIKAAGLPVPRKSRCWLCPNQTQTEWQEVHDDFPEQFRMAVEMENAITERDDAGGLWLSRHRRPLDSVDFADAVRPAILSLGTDKLAASRGGIPRGLSAPTPSAGAMEQRCGGGSCWT